MLTIIYLFVFALCALSVPLGYAVYRASRIAIIERMGRQLCFETMPRLEDEPVALPGYTVQEVANGLTTMANALPSMHDLLNRPPNPDLDIVYSTSGKFTRTIPGQPIRSYFPDANVIKSAPYVKQEFEQTGYIGECET